MPDPTLLADPPIDLTVDDAPPERTDERAGKYLLIRLDQSELGLPVSRVREVMDMQPITSVPNSHPLIPGVINLRGKVIPVLDLRLKFGLPAAPPTPSSSIVVIRTAIAFIEVIMGVVVDEVLDIFVAQSGEITPPLDPNAPPSILPHFLGATLVHNCPVILLDIEEVLNNLDVQRLPQHLDPTV